MKESEFHSFFAKGCVLLLVSMALWRVHFKRRIEGLAWDWPWQVIEDFALALSWVSFWCIIGGRTMTEDEINCML